MKKFIYFFLVFCLFIAVVSLSVSAEPSKKITVVVEEGPNYIYHLMGVAKVGFDSDYADIYKDTVEPEDKEYLKNHKNLLTNVECHGGELVYMMIFFPNYISLESKSDFVEYFNLLNEGFKTNNFSKFLQKYALFIEKLKEWPAVQVNGEYGIKEDYLKSFSEYKDVINELGQIYVRNYETYDKKVWPAEKLKMDKVAKELNDYLKDKNIISRWEKVTGETFKFNEYQIVLCSAIKNGPNANSLGYERNIFYSGLSFDFLTQFISHETGTHILMDSYGEVDKLGKYDFDDLYKAMELRARFYNTIVLNTNDIYNIYSKGNLCAKYMKIYGDIYNKNKNISPKDLLIQGLETYLQENRAGSPVDTKEILAGYNVYEYPTQEELKDCKFQKSWIEIETLSARDINDTFSNINDLEWLKPVARECKVVFVGENHWYKTTHNLCDRILFALNTFDRYPLLIIENQFSISAFFDYYVGLTNDKKAQDFYKNVIYDMVLTEEDYKLLEHIRKWNTIHPDRRIHIGATDIEHDYKMTLSKIIIPYFKLLEPDFNIDIDKTDALDLGNLVENLEKKLQKAKAKNLTGAYSFLTPQYIECVLENLKSRFLSKKCGYDKSGFNKSRQEAIIRNLTDPRFFGNYLINGKVMLYGGGQHAKTRIPLAKGGNFYTEGHCLNFEFEPTKGKVFSIYINGLARKLGEMANVNLDLCLYGGDPYTALIKKMQELYNKKLISPEKYYFIDAGSINDFEKLILEHADNDAPLLVKNVEYNKILEASKKISDSFYKKTSRYIINHFYYDRYIYIPYSDDIKVNKKI